MKKNKSLETMLVLILALLLLYWFKKNNYLLIAAIALAFIGAFIPYFARKIDWLWMKLATIMGTVMSKILLTIVFIFFLLPLSLLSKLFRKNNGIIFNKQADSYFTNRDFTYTKESIKNVW